MKIKSILVKILIIWLIIGAFSTVLLVVALVWGSNAFNTLQLDYTVAQSAALKAIYDDDVIDVMTILQKKQSEDGGYYLIIENSKNERVEYRCSEEEYAEYQPNDKIKIYNGFNETDMFKFLFVRKYSEQS